jgi:hypothetical protein
MLLQQGDLRVQLEAIGAALFYSLVALTAVMVQGFRTIQMRPAWWMPAWRESHRLASDQVLWVALALCAALAAVGDIATSRTFLATWLVLLYGSLTIGNRYLPAKIIETIYEGRGELALLLIDSELDIEIEGWRESQKKNGVESIDFRTNFAPADMAEIERLVRDRNVTTMLILNWPEDPVLNQLVEICERAGARLLIRGEQRRVTGRKVTWREEAGLQVYGIQRLTD